MEGKEEVDKERVKLINEGDICRAERHYAELTLQKPDGHCERLGGEDGGTVGNCVEAGSTMELKGSATGWRCGKETVAWQQAMAQRLRTTALDNTLKGMQTLTLIFSYFLSFGLFNIFTESVLLYLFECKGNTC